MTLICEQLKIKKMYLAEACLVLSLNILIYLTLAVQFI